MKHSVTIETFLNFLHTCPETYRIQRALQEEEEKRTQDLLHKLELEHLSYHETAQTAKILAEARKRRRQAKDAAEELEPIVDYIKQNWSAIRSVELLLGEVRKAENRHKNRFYVPKCPSQKGENA